MFNVKAVGLICALVLVVGLAGCKFYETDKANKLVDAANASIKDANDRADKGTNKLQELETGALQAEDQESCCSTDAARRALGFRCHPKPPSDATFPRRVNRDIRESPQIRCVRPQFSDSTDSRRRRSRDLE